MRLAAGFAMRGKCGGEIFYIHSLILRFLEV